jgi:hypothetical protein
MWGKQPLIYLLYIYIYHISGCQWLSGQFLDSMLGVGDDDSVLVRYQRVMMMMMMMLMMMMLMMMMMMMNVMS